MSLEKQPVYSRLQEFKVDRCGFGTKLKSKQHEIISNKETGKGGKQMAVKQVPIWTFMGISETEFNELLKKTPKDQCVFPGCKRKRHVVDDFYGLKSLSCKAHYEKYMGDSN
ncbi:MAG: hypothetical protein WC325_11190 [Candidatus Bathyarchaeia archaeon]